MSDSIEWRWVDVDGSQNVVRLGQLTDALASGALPHFTLVWRTGWTEWVSANRVAELAQACGSAHSAPINVARLSETAGTPPSPPSPPVEQYRTLSPVHVNSLLRPRRAGAPSTVPPPPPPPRPGQRAPLPPPPIRGSASKPPGAPMMTPTPIPVRDVQPTLAGDELPVRSPTLRPVGGMPPPPRTMPQQKLPVIVEMDDDDDDDVDVEILGQIPNDTTRNEVRAETPAASERRSTPPPLHVKKEPDAALLPSSAPSESALGASQRPSLSRVAPDLGGASRRAVTWATAISVLLPGTLLLSAALVQKRWKEASTAEAVAVPERVIAHARPTPAVAPGCSLVKPVTRLAESVFIGVPVLMAGTGDGRVAIGFAGTKEHARGIAVDPLTLDAASVFEETVTDSTTLGVVPLAGTKALEFAVDRADPKLSFARTIDAATRFTIGVTSEGFSRAVGEKVDVIWPGKSKTPVITTPRVASVPGLGHAITFRHGGQEGKVLVGWLTEDGAKQSDLKAVGTDATLVGTPTISATQQAVLVTFASKIGAADGWRTELALGPRGGLPARANPMTVPAGGPGGETISPSSEGLTDGRFLVQWTEGSAGNRVVRAQLLSANLVAVGEPVTLSTPEQNAGQGALSVHGSQALALFLVKKESSHELWGASLRCR